MRSQFNAENETIAGLLLDAGNSRLKWTWVRRGRLQRGGAVAYTPRRQFDSRLRRLLRQASGAGRVLVCSVAGADIDRCIRRAARAAQLPAPQFARSVRRAAGVTNAYAEPWRLGVDRWVAMIGARQLFPGEALCLVSVGTALTLDLLAASGRHHGGAIVPGPALMVQTLLERTAGIRRRARGGGGRRPQPVCAGHARRDRGGRAPCLRRGHRARAGRGRATPWAAARARALGRWSRGAVAAARRRAPA